MTPVFQLAIILAVLAAVVFGVMKVSESNDRYTAQQACISDAPDEIAAIGCYE